MQLIIHHKGQQNYLSTWEAMKTFTQTRDANTLDELWLLEHPPIFTLGQAGKEEHILNRSNIPILKVDRGGQVTYHGPGQLMTYALVDLRRKKLSVHEFVRALENITIQFLHDFHINAHTRPKAPGVYVNDKKICSIGLRVRHHCTYHGLALNINMDLTPFRDINPCGYADLQMTKLTDFTDDKTVNDIIPVFIQHFCKELRYNL